MSAQEQTDALRRYRAAYAEHRAREGRGLGGTRELLALPYLHEHAQARAWTVRARSYERLLRSVIRPAARAVAPRALSVADLGAGNGWLCYRLQSLGCHAVAVDMRVDNVDGLGAAAPYAGHLDVMFGRAAASFDALPLADDAFDVVIFNAALHYALDLPAVLAEAARVCAPHGRIVIVDSPFYAHAADGRAMVAEKQRTGVEQFGEHAADLLALPAIEFLTPARLTEASGPLGIAWRRLRVQYPLWYEVRPLLARLRGRRAPSRFDIWESVRS